ncbi:teneurin-3 [Eurytemora carolleeae]|uniref:teneurin-3 n=1 Tax=Eurytemora carolleeae TaxID=1294199 RepID=UPI000C776CC4|nr:teneurin-3 [Eurytemora carolleeae]|eukprot:XP_023325302.1 teneurin-3-like [Eurytemora affinis]
MMFKSLILVAALVPLCSAGFRCTFGNWACTTGCVFLGQTSGVCDANWDCHCSEKSISLNSFKRLLPSRCLLGDSFCEGTCHAMGRSNGTCKDNNCSCSNTYLTPSEFLLCAAESTCRTHCQANGSATGVCLGWSCECKSSEAEAGSALEVLMQRMN